MRELVRAPEPEPVPEPAPVVRRTLPLPVAPAGPVTNLCMDVAWD